MTDPRIEKLARLLVEYSVETKEGDQIAIMAGPVAEPLVREIYRSAIRAGAFVEPVVEMPGLREILLKEGNRQQLEYVSPFRREIVDNFDVRIAIDSALNTRELSGVDPERQRIQAQAGRPLGQKWMERSARGEARWVVAMFPTYARAQEADMSLTEFEDFAYTACLLDESDPIAAWRGVKERQQRLVEWLAGKREVHITGVDTDLRVSIEGRPFINCYGDKNMPDGEVFTGPVEDGVNGHIRYSFPAIFGGREVEDVRLWFENGVVVKAEAAKNLEYLEKMLDIDEGARRLGEFAFGTNYGIDRFVKQMLYDEKIGGTLHAALGMGYPESGSKNESGLHWDMLCDLRSGGEIRVDGELFAKDGKYLLWE